MAIISDKLNKILSAVFGKDVRQALHDGLDAINKETESTTSRQDYLDRKYDEQIKNMTLQDPSSAEIVDMRVAANGTTFEKAGDRLNYFDEQLDTIVQENAKKLDYLTPKMFGAVCDGIKDDTEALREAIYTSHITGKLLFFPNGCKCLVSDSLNYYNGSYYNVNLNMRGVLPNSYWEYSLSEFGGIVIKKSINLFYNATIKGEISNLSIVGIRDENLHFFDLCDLNGIYIHGCNITNFGAFLYDSGMKGVSRIDSNAFLSVFYFHRYNSVAKTITDSYITNNYINGGVEPTNNACFEFQNGNGSTIQGNFIDYYKVIYRPQPVATVQFPVSIGNQYQVFLYLYEVNHGGAFYFSSSDDTFNWTDESKLAKLSTYEKCVYTGKDGVSYEIPTYIAMGRHSSSVNIKNAYIQSNVGNIVFIQNQNTEYALGEFNVSFSGVSRYRSGSVSLKQGADLPYYNAGAYIRNSYDLWFIETLDSLPSITTGWCKYPNGYRVHVNNQNYKFVNKFNQETSQWEAKWLETDDI